MDITDFIVSHRTDALLVGDYNAYRARLTRRLHALRKRLGRATPRNKKYAAHAPITAQDVAQDTESVRLLLVLAERAWANAMHMRSVHSTDPSMKGIVGSTRRHIISRLQKATTHATRLVQILQDRETSGASVTDVLEARAYQASLSGALWMEKQRWSESLREYSTARVIYAALEKQASRQTLRDILSSSIDPSIRYAAYQLKLPRSAPLPTLAVRYFPVESEVKAEVETVDATCLQEGEGGDKMEVDGAPDGQTINWRSRMVPIEDAAISQALTAASAAEVQLSSWLSGADGQSANPNSLAANYDSVIIASQDAVDATKTAIDELLGEGVDQSDKRMQALQVTKTAVNYALVGWRIGRNRVLCGPSDGLDFETRKPSKRGKGKSQGAIEDQSSGRLLAQLRARVALYDAILQSLDSVRDLPGIAGDTSFMEELGGKRCYFQALRCTALARAHAAQSNPKNALALFARALELVQGVSQVSVEASTNNVAKPPQVDVTQDQLNSLLARVQGYVLRYQGIVQIENLFSEAARTAPPAKLPLIERLDEYPAGDGDLTNLVAYPPKVQAIPVKPLFFDVAWNYIDYPKEEKKAVQSERKTAAQAPVPEAKESKRGWFGFGRS